MGQHRADPKASTPPAHSEGVCTIIRRNRPQIRQKVFQLQDWDTVLHTSLQTRCCQCRRSDGFNWGRGNLETAGSSYGYAYSDQRSAYAVRVRAAFTAVINRKSLAAPPASRLGARDSARSVMAWGSICSPRKENNTHIRRSRSDEHNAALLSHITRRPSRRGGKSSPQRGTHRTRR